MKKYLFSELLKHGMIGRDGITYRYDLDDDMSDDDLHTHDYYEIVYICGGKAVQVVDDKPYYVSKGWLIVMSPSERHHHYSLGHLDMLTCCFKDTNLLSYLPKASAFPIVVNLDSYFQQQIEQLFFLLMEEIKQEKLQHVRAEWDFLDSIFLLIMRNLKTTTQNYAFSMEQVLSYIMANLKDVQFSEAVKIYGTSEANFCRMFKKTFGMTFTEFIANMRIEHAKKLLLNTQLTIEAVYQQCGYNNSRPFFLDFKKKCGMTPRQYRLKKSFLFQMETN